MSERTVGQHGGSRSKHRSIFRPSRDTLIGTASVILFIIGWQVASIVGPTFAFPSWARIFRAFSDVSLYDTAITVLRVLVSMVFSFVIGVFLATLMSYSPTVEAFLRPLINLIMAVPAVCWVVFAILWLVGIETRIFFIMCIVIAPVFLIDSLDAMKAVPPDLRQMVESFRPSTLQIYRKVVFPAIVPNLLTSWKINLTLAVRIVTIAELVGALTGIGHGLVLAQEMFSVAAVFAWTIVLVVVLFAFQLVLTLVERRVLSWREA